MYARFFVSFDLRRGFPEGILIEAGRFWCNIGLVGPQFPEAPRQENPFGGLWPAKPADLPVRIPERNLGRRRLPQVPVICRKG